MRMDHLTFGVKSRQSGTEKQSTMHDFVRPARPEDLSRLAEIHVYGWRFAYAGLVPDRELWVDRTVEKGLTWWADLVKPPADRALVYDDGLVKGFSLHLPCRDEDAGDAHEIGALYVEPAFLRQGAGRALVGASEEAARHQGRRRLVLWVLEKNRRAVEFYQACGFRPDGARKVLEEWDGAVELRYAKDLV